MRNAYRTAQLPYFAFFKLPLADDSESSARSNLRGRSRNIRRQGDVVRQGTKGKKRERKGRKDAAHPVSQCMQLALFRAMFMRRIEPVFLPSGNNADGMRGSALAYCLKLLIGLRTDAAFPRCAVSLSLSLSLFS